MKLIFDSNNLIYLNKILNWEVFINAKKFMSDLTTVAVVAGAILTVLSIIFTLLVSQIDALEEWQKHSKKVRKVAIIGVVIFLVSGFYKLVIEDYFGFTIDPSVKTTFIESVKYYL